MLSYNLTSNTRLHQSVCLFIIPSIYLPPGGDNSYYDLAQNLRQRITDMKIKIDRQLRILAALKDRVKDQVVEMQRLEVRRHNRDKNTHLPILRVQLYSWAYWMSRKLRMTISTNKMCSFSFLIHFNLFKKINFILITRSPLFTDQSLNVISVNQYNKLTFFLHPYWIWLLPYLVTTNWIIKMFIIQLPATS